MRSSLDKMFAVESWRASGFTQNECSKTLGVKRTDVANWVGRNKFKKASGVINLRFSVNIQLNKYVPLF